MSTPLIEARGLSKTYTLRKKAGKLKRERTTVEDVRDVSFSVAEGELIGYIGPNGAGKSTTIKMLTGILTPTHGEVEVAGLVPYRRRELNALNIGVVFGQRSQLWCDLLCESVFAGAMVPLWFFPPLL